MCPYTVAVFISIKTEIVWQTQFLRFYSVLLVDATCKMIFFLKHMSSPSKSIVDIW